ncbi:hypothetical protein ACX12L_05485 [Alicycliphilus sp. T452]
MAVRVVELGDVSIKCFNVVSEASGTVYPMRAIRFRQTSTATYVGRLPAGRYQPKEMQGPLRAERAQHPGEQVTADRQEKRLHAFQVIHKHWVVEHRSAGLDGNGRYGETANRLIDTCL